jgi:hypothetical protein
MNVEERSYAAEEVMSFLLLTFVGMLPVCIVLQHLRIAPFSTLQYLLRSLNISVKFGLKSSAPTYQQA